MSGTGKPHMACYGGSNRTLAQLQLPKPGQPLLGPCGLWWQLHRV